MNYNVILYLFDNTGEHNCVMDHHIITHKNIALRECLMSRVCVCIIVPAPRHAGPRPPASRLAAAGGRLIPAETKLRYSKLNIL